MNENKNKDFIDKLYKDSANELPPPLLDKRILAASKINKRSALHKLTIPMSAAAAVLIGLTFILQIPQQIDEQLKPEMAPFIDSQTDSSKKEGKRKKMENKRADDAYSEPLSPIDHNPKVNTSITAPVNDTEYDAFLYEELSGAMDVNQDDADTANSSNALTAPPEEPIPAHKPSELMDSEIQSSNIPSPSESMMRQKPQVGENTQLFEDKPSAINHDLEAEQQEILPSPQLENPEEEARALSKPENLGASLPTQNQRIDNATEKFYRLVENKEFDQARSYLEQLKKEYPEKDWEKLELWLNEAMKLPL